MMLMDHGGEDNNARQKWACTDVSTLQKHMPVKAQTKGLERGQIPPARLSDLLPTGILTNENHSSGCKVGHHSCPIHNNWWGCTICPH